MIVNSPFSNSHKKTDIISTPLKEINVIVSPLKQQSFSERRNSKSNSFHSFDLKKIEKNSLKLHFENKKSNVKEPTTQSLLKNRNSDRSSKEITEFNKNFEICKKFNILLEKNETLNEILEKKIEKLGNCSKENSCLLQEISILQQQNLKLELEVEGLNAKVGFLDKEIEIKQQEDLEKNDIISEFRDLIKQLEKEMVLLREEEHNGKTDFEVKSAEIEQMKKDLMKKQRLEGQLIIFIKENEKLRKVKKFYKVFH